MTVSASRLSTLSNAVRALANELADKRSDETVAELFEAADFLGSCSRAGASYTLVETAGEPEERKPSEPVHSLSPYASAEKLREWLKVLDSTYGPKPTPITSMIAEMRAVIDRAEVERMRDALLALEGALGEGGLYENGALCRVAREGLGKSWLDVPYEGPAVLQFRYTTIEHSGKFGPGAVVLHFPNLPRAEAANKWLVESAERLLNRKATMKAHGQDRAP